MSFAFFDYDNTLMHGDIGPLFARHLLGLRKQALAEQQPTSRVRAQTRFAVRAVPYAAWMAVQAGLYRARAVRRSTIVRNAYRAFRGMDARRFEEAIPDFVAKQVPSRLYPAMLDRIRQHQAQGIRCVIITTGLEPLVVEAARHLPGEVEIVGCRLEARDGRFTGRVDGPLYGADKANIALAFCRAAGADPLECHAYTDHYSDVHMLTAVGHGHVVHPRGRLERLAVAQGWETLRPTL